MPRWADLTLAKERRVIIYDVICGPTDKSDPFSGLVLGSDVAIPPFHIRFLSRYISKIDIFELSKQK